MDGCYWSHDSLDREIPIFFALKHVVGGKNCLDVYSDLCFSADSSFF